MRRLRWLPFVFLAAIVGVAAGTLLFSTFMIYDDEGYVLFSLKNFAETGGLYERVYSQYGPFFYVFNQMLHFAGLQFTNTDGRLLTFACWLGAAGLCAALVWRTTRSHAATTFTLGGVYLHLWTMTSEPSHPGGLIVLLTALAAWCGVRWSDQPGKLAAAVGALGAALVLTKINVGVFLLAGAGAWWALHLDDAPLSRPLRSALISAALALLPVALMAKLIDREWVATFALVAGTGGLTVGFAVARGARPLTRWSHLVPLCGAAAAVTALTVIIVMAQGTSAHALIDGVLLGPLRHPLVYTAAFTWGDGTVAVLAISFALAAWVALAPSPRSLGAVAFARLLTGASYLLSSLLVVPVSVDHLALSYGLATAWIFVQPLGRDEETQPARAWLGLLFVGQALHAFPVAGSQISWGTFLCVPLLVIGLHDLVRRHATDAQPIVRRLRHLSAALLVAAITVRCGEFAWVGFLRVRSSDDLRLPGANSLRLPEHLTTTLRLLSRNATAHADVLFSLPGLESFHLWTGLPPPTPANATHWFTLLSAVQQEAIRQKLAASPRSCVIVQRDLYNFLVRTGVQTESPLTRWLEANYEPAFTLETYEFWVRKGRQIAALDTATLFHAAPGATPGHKISITLASAALRDITRIELGRFDGDRSTVLGTWAAGDGQLSLTPLNSAGQPAGPTRPVTFPFNAEGLVRIDLLTDRLPSYAPPNHCILYLRDAAGQRVAEARFVQ